IAVDARNGFPLQVSVYSAKQSTPALQVGFTSLRFGSSPASVFAVPSGTKTVTKVIRPDGHDALPVAGPTGVRTVGKDWATVGAVPLTSKQTAPELRQLSEVGTTVSGSWGTGRLVTSSLLDALVLPDGTVLVGFVTPATLEAAAASIGH
ncbi:MAG TPA: hypothetical protein VKV25_00275, partial [Acidimicrobiales bacterium]|nr:hypothetical protein [Acidimicrobiales bacterium]